MAERHERGCCSTNRPKTKTPAELERDMLDFKEVAIEFFEFYYGQVFNHIAITDYLNPQEIFASTDEKWEITYSDSASAFFFGIHDLKKVSEHGLEQLSDYGTFPLFCFQLAIHPIKEIPTSTDPAFNKFLKRIKFFHKNYHCLGLPNKEEEALLAVSIFLNIVPDNPDDKKKTAKVKKYIDAIFLWYCCTYRPENLGKKLKIYCWSLELLIWDALHFVWKHKEKHGYHSLTVQCLFHSPKTQAKRIALQNAQE